MAELKKLREPTRVGDVDLRNRAVMAPMTRSRAQGNTPNALMAEYYGQRAREAGLIITEGTAPSANGIGYARIPGIYSQAQIEGWKLVTQAVHAEEGKIFVQLMHCGRIAHPLNLPDGAEVLAPSAVAAAGDMYTDQEGPKPLPTPRAMTGAEVESAIEEFVTGAKNAVAAGFDGVELHAANGYLIEQFLHPKANQRDDAWGGDAQARNRFAIEVAKRSAEAVGQGRVGIRLSPYGAFNDTGEFDGVDAQYEALAIALRDIGIAYVHIVDQSSLGAPVVPDRIKQILRDSFAGPIILSGGYDGNHAEADLVEGKGELVAFGRSFLANPDLITRFEQEAELNEPRHELFYTPGAEGFTDYPTLG